MRLLELEIVAFGAIANLRIDLSREDAGLHLIYGPNEAGKSTTLRAILGLLFGIEHHSSDAKLFGRDQLRLRGRLLDAQGQVLAVTRRKGRSNTLFDESDRPLDELVLQRALCGLTAPVYRSMFGLDHERLRAGGEQLRLGQGDLGESLFQAGLGVSGLHQVLGLLGKEADELWKPRGQKPLNQEIEAHAAARKSVREHAKRAEAFRAQEEDLEQARKRRAELTRRRGELQTEQSRLKRLLSVLPMLAKRRDYRERRAALGAIVALPADCEPQRRAAQEERGTCASQIAPLESALAELVQRRAALRIPESLLEHSPELISEIRNRLGSHLKAQHDLPVRRGELRECELEAAAVLRELGQPVPLAEVEALRVDTATAARITKLAREHSGLCARLQAAEHDLAVAEAELAEAQAALAALPPAKSAASDPQSAGGTVFGGIAPALRGGAMSDGGIAPALRGGATALPADAQVEAFRKRFERIEQTSLRQDDAAERLDGREERARLQLERIAREGVPPTEADLLKARAERDALLPQLRAVFAGEVTAHPRLVLEFEALQRRADETADRLRRELGRVAELAQLHEERDGIERERARLRERRAEQEAAAAALAAEWQKLWEPLAVVARSPIEMQPLLAKVTALLKSGERGRAEALRRKHEAEHELARWQSSWALLMARLRLAADASAEEAQAVLEELRRLFTKVDAMRPLRARIEAMESDAEQFERDVRALCANLPELSGLPFAQAAEQLAQRHHAAQRDTDERARIDREVRKSGDKLALLRGRAEQAERTLSTLMKQAGAADLGALERAEQRCNEAREIDRQLAGVEDDLLALGEGTGIDELAAQAEELGPDRIRARLEDIEEELAAIDDERSGLDNHIMRTEIGLDSLRRDDLAAQAAAEAEQHLSRIKSQAHGYVRKRLAAELLQREIRRYRDTNQGPIVGRASELFARLTLARYPKLQVGYDDADAPVLQCVDELGRIVAVDALSDGARDQLYLALRLASLERFAQHNPPMPLVLDDVLIHFDDERARAALEILSELAASMQVLFFTHHRRIAELARSAVARPRLCEHRLGEERASTLAPPSEAV